MKAVVQRVNSASVICEALTVGEIGSGLLVLVGVANDDTKKEAEVLARKIAGLRIFSDAKGLMNLSVKDIDGEILAISNFTLCGDTSHGRRPNFMNAAKADIAKPLYEYFISCLMKEEVKRVAEGVFGGDMTVNLQNDGPVTIILDTEDYK